MRALERNYLIAKKNLRFFSIPYILICIAFLIIIPAFFGINNLSAQEAAVPLEQLVALMGILLFTPLFHPEQDIFIRELLESKYTEYLRICLLRLLYNIVFLVLLITAFTVAMKMNESNIIYPMHIFGTFSTAFFLGAMGLCVAGLCSNVIVGYMVTILFYLINITTHRASLKIFYLFSMAQGSYKDKWWLFFISIGIIATTFLILRVQRYHR